ncbi:hypothetical protein BDR07DRAFT_1488253 [Suillus spraguei]|nr:hypothetical protein BDR07DRAFT_1488253 [Suillus spraguei]
MALDYLTIPATSVGVEWLLNHGHLILSHVCSRSNVQSTHALLCLSYWSQLGLVKNEDVLTVSSLTDVVGVKELEFENGWDQIHLG